MSDLDAIKLTKKGNSLVPADLHAQEYFDGIKDGDDVLMAPAKSRSEKHHVWLETIISLTSRLRIWESSCAITPSRSP